MLGQVSQRKLIMCDEERLMDLLLKIMRRDETRRCEYIFGYTAGPWPPSNIMLGSLSREQGNREQGTGNRERGVQKSINDANSFC